MEAYMTSTNSIASDDAPQNSFKPRYTLITNLAKFALGQVVATPGALKLLEKHQSNPLLLLNRHVQGDGGDLCADDAKLNEQALEDGSRIFSVYRLVSPEVLASTLRNKRERLPTIWIITDAADDAGVRCVTTLMLPEDY
jgi:hypothetical protein